MNKQQREWAKYDEKELGNFWMIVSAKREKSGRFVVQYQRTSSNHRPTPDCSYQQAYEIEGMSRYVAAGFLEGLYEEVVTSPNETNYDVITCSNPFERDESIDDDVVWEDDDLNDCEYISTKEWELSNKETNE